MLTDSAVPAGRGMLFYSPGVAKSKSSKKPFNSEQRYLIINHGEHSRLNFAYYFVNYAGSDTEAASVTDPST